MENTTQEGTASNPDLFDEMEANIEELLTTEGEEPQYGSNFPVLTEEFAWLHKVLQFRMDAFSGQATAYPRLADIPSPDLSKFSSPYSNYVNQANLTKIGRIIVLLALAPQVCPEILDRFSLKNKFTGHAFTQFGGAKGDTYRGILPTVATAMFVIAGNSLKRRVDILQMFEEENILIKNKVITLEQTSKRDPLSSSIIHIGKEFQSLFTTGNTFKPKFSSEFPAQLLTTQLEWESLVLEFDSKRKIDEILNWLEHKETILKTWEMDKIFKKGFRSLFYGPPGTGKTLTASLLGKKTGRDVYRIDISQVVSKYIGETEKNLANVFEMAENKEWILFFDEADALFGKRTQTSDSKDRYANQEVSYLLQRIEDFPGVVLLSTNLRSNIDPAFMRRFQSLVHFPIPSAPRRYELWQRSIGKAPFDKTINFKNIAKRYEISGGMIINVIRACCVVAITRETPIITEDDIIEEIKAEFRKEGKTV